MKCCHKCNMTITALMLFALFLALLPGNKAISGLDVSDDSFPYSLFLDANERYKLVWRYNETDITFKTTVKTKGYIGFGLSGNGGMRGADIVVGWVKDGKGYFKDRHAKDNMKPELDPQQNWKLLHAEEDMSSTTLVFTRPLRSCDTENDLNIKRETQRVIWSFSVNDPTSEEDITYHGPTDRGSRSVYLMLDRPTKVSMVDNAQHFDIRHPEHVLPSADTTYWRTPYKLPVLAEKHHIIGMAPLIPKENEGIIHHILLYICSSAEINDSMHGQSYNLFQQPSAMSSCQGIMSGWGIGGGPYYLPEHVGFPIGGETKTKFVLMETHYDNQQKRSDIRDNSGLRLFYTSDLRQHDAGMLLVGVAVTDTHAIPPFAENFRSVGYCTGRCTSQALASRPAGVKLFSSILHSHLLGRKIRLHHVRNGTELPLLMADETFDFNFQESRAFPKEVTIMPGDDLILECDYGSVDRTTITTGGLGSDQEMCLAFLMYYPFVDFRQCESEVTVGQSLSFMSEEVTVSGRRITSPKRFENNTLVEVLNTINWRVSSNKEKFEKAVSKGRIFHYCDRAEESMSSSVLEMDAPEIKVPYVEELDFCRLGDKLQEKTVDDIKTPQGFPHWTQLDGDNYYIFWKYDELSITFHLVAKTTGWVGFGLSPDGEMENSDVVIGWVDNNQVQFSDRFADRTAMPRIDEIQNWNILEGWERNGITELVFRRNLATCDPLDRNITVGNIHLIWSYNGNDPKDASSISIHSKRGSKVVRLIDGPIAPSYAMETMEDGTLQIEFRNPMVPITLLPSTYYNVGFKMPELKQKYHLVKIEALIEPGKEDFIFHLGVFGCPTNRPDNFHGRAFDIMEENVPEILACSVLIGFWLKGNEEYEYPPEFGYPIGGDDNPIKFVRLETLFSNPGGLNGLRDSSGLRFTLVPASRNHDVGLMRVGHSADFGYSHLIPQGVGDFLLRGYCMADCLAQGLAKQTSGITVIGVSLHSHNYATSIVLRHIRKGVEMMPIFRETNFQFNNQDMVMLQKPVSIVPGDEIVIDCHLDTRKSSKLLFGSPFAEGQPCLALLMYYPPIDIGICESASPTADMLEVFDNFKYNGSAWAPNILSPEEWKGKTFNELMFTGKIQVVKEETKRALQTKMTDGNTTSFCFAKAEQPFMNLMNPSKGMIRPPPKISYRNEPVSICPENIVEPTTRPTRYYTTPRDGGSSSEILSAQKMAILCIMFIGLLI